MKNVFPKLIFSILNNYMIYQKKMKIRKFEKFRSNLHDKTEYIIHLRNLKQSLNHGLLLKTFSQSDNV